MNKNILYLLLVISLVASCKKDDDNAFDKSPDERLNETLTKYQTALTTSTYGWNANLITGDGGSYRFYFSFDDKNRVQMYSDFDSSTATTIRESSYRLKALQQPSLIFDTYSYIHILSDPDGAVSGGAYGSGLKSDFEFAVDTVAADSIRLTGRFNGSKLSLYKAAQGDKNIWANKQVTNGVVNFRNFWKINLYWRRLTYSNTQYELLFDSTLKRVTVSWGSGSQRQSVTRGYYFWANGVYFSDPVVNGSVSIPGFSITGYNAGTQVLSVTVNGTAANIAGYSNAPLNPDVKAAPDRWWQQSSSTDNYWISFDGFHKNGVDDAFNIKSLKNDTAKFYFLLYKANSNGYDAFFTIYLDSAKNAIDVIDGSWLSINSTASTGLTRFSELDLRDPAVPWPATGPAALTRSQMLNTGGYYFVQTSAYTYDQVSVSDPTTWISWYWVF